MSFHIRAFQGADLANVTSLWNISMAADPISEHRLLHDFVLDPHFRAEPFVLVEQGGELVGFVLGMRARQDVPSDNAADTGVIVGFGVHPDHRRQGIGTALFDALEQRWRSQGVERVQIGPWIPGYLVPGVEESAYPEAITFLGDRGYAFGGKPVSMRALLTGYVPAADVPATARTLSEEGIAIRPAVSADAPDLLAFASNHFSHWETYVRTALRSLASAKGDATLHVALDGDEIIGFAMTNGERFGPFGVNEEYRGRGVGAVLLSRALCAMRAANMHLAYFLWTSDQTARLYNRHGFEIVRRFTMINKSLIQE